jgi:ribosomal protein RSM22 (predicted rRNA methylase)
VKILQRLIICIERTSQVTFSFTLGIPLTFDARMDVLYHSLLLMFDDKSFFAPVMNPQRIVDMGTGTGVWALDVGDKYPSAHGRV